jgi:hypothetical protein
VPGAMLEEAASVSFTCRVGIPSMPQEVASIDNTLPLLLIMWNEELEWKLCSLQMK